MFVRYIYSVLIVVVVVICSPRLVSIGEVARRREEKKEANGERERRKTSPELDEDR